MYKVMFTFPTEESQETQPQGRPKSCPYCNSTLLEQHGNVPHHRLVGGKAILTLRCLCNGCGRTFRVYPKGIKPYTRISPHVKAVATFLWTTGISGKSVARATKELGIPISVVTACRYGIAINSHHPAGRIQNPLVILKGGHIPENLEETNPEKTVLLGIIADAADGKIGLVALFDQEVDLTRVEKLAEEGGCQLAVETLPFSMRQFLASPAPAHLVH